MGIPNEKKVEIVDTVKVKLIPNNNEMILNYKYVKGVREVFPAHPMVSNCVFTDNEEEEATLLNSIAVVAEKNGLSRNDLSHLFPAILRMLKSDIEWSK